MPPTEDLKQSTSLQLNLGGQQEITHSLGEAGLRYENMRSLLCTLACHTLVQELTSQCILVY